MFLFISYFSYLPMFWVPTYKLTQADRDIKKLPRVYQRSNVPTTPVPLAAP